MIFFKLTKDQLNKIQEWEKFLPQAEEGGRFTYSFTPTSLGVILVVSDVITGKKLDVTEYEYW